MVDGTPAQEGGKGEDIAAGLNTLDREGVTQVPILAVFDTQTAHEADDVLSDHTHIHGFVAVAEDVILRQVLAHFGL